MSRFGSVELQALILENLLQKDDQVKDKLPTPKPTTCCGDRLKPCKCGADVWDYIGDHDHEDWCEAEYKCGHCGKTIYVELPD